MFNYKMTIAYDGTPFCGWQAQSNSISIQTLIEQALSTVLKCETKIIGAGRTDAGVHAKGQTANFKYKTTLDLGKALYSLNGLLPPEIRIVQLTPVAEDFHSRFSAKRKIYHYHLTTDRTYDPFTRAYHYHLTTALDLDSIRKAITYLLGTHNFRAFANDALKGSALHDPVKTLYDIRIVTNLPHIRFEFEGSGFLYKMVRNLMGALIKCGRGNLTPEEIKAILESQDRKKASPAAPAHGLCLYQVIYD